MYRLKIPAFLCIPLFLLLIHDAGATYASEIVDVCVDSNATDWHGYDSPTWIWKPTWVCGDSTVVLSGQIHVRIRVRNLGTNTQSNWYVGSEAWKVTNVADPVNNRNSRSDAFYNGLDNSGIDLNFYPAPSVWCTTDSNDDMASGATRTVVCTYYNFGGTSSNERIMFWVHERDLSQNKNNACEATGDYYRCGTASNCNTITGVDAMQYNNGCFGGAWWSDALVTVRASPKVCIIPAPNPYTPDTSTSYLNVTQFKISWRAVQGATSYDVRIDDNPATTPQGKASISGYSNNCGGTPHDVCIDSITPSSYTDNYGNTIYNITANAQAGYRYNFWMGARNTCGGSPIPGHFWFMVDTTAPSGNSVSINSGAAYTNSQSVTLSLSCTDSLSGCYTMSHSNDGITYTQETYGGESWISTPASWTLSSGDGTKTVYAKFRDRAGNQMATAVTDTIILDTTFPTASLGGVPSTWQSTDASITLSCSDTGGSGCDSSQDYYYLDTDSACPAFSTLTYATYTGAVTVDSLKWFCYSVADNAGNRVTPSGTVITVDKTAPSGGSVGNPAYRNTVSIPVTVSRGSDAESSMSPTDSDYLLKVSSATLGDAACGAYGSYADADVSETAAATSYTYTGGSNGRCYKFQYIVKNSAGLSTTYTGTDITMVDTTAPSLVGYYSPSSPLSTDQVTFTAGATDATSGNGYSSSGIKNIKIYIDNNLATTCTSSTCTYTGGPYSAGTHTYYLTAEDNAGNTERNPESGTRSFTVAADTAPTTQPITYTGTCSTGSTITLSCLAQDANQNDNTLSVKAWAGTCTSGNCFATRSWSTYNDVAMTASATAEAQPFTKTWDITNDVGTTLAATCQATDAAGSVSDPFGDAYPLCTIGGCASPPTFSSIAASPNPAKAGSVTITFTSSATLSSNPTVTVKPGQTGSGRTATYSSNSGNSYTYTFTVLSGDTNGVADIAVSGTDANNCQGSSIGTFTIDTAAPTTSIANVGGDTSSPYFVASTGSTNIVINGESGMTCRYYTTDSAYSDSSGTACTTSGTTATCAVTSTSGSNTKYIACKDAAGNGQDTSSNKDVTWTVGCSSYTAGDSCAANRACCWKQLTVNPITGECRATPTPGCTESICGNGIVESPEVCDTGRTYSGATCSNDCSLLTETACTDNNDNDGDGRIDCLDSDCAGAASACGTCKHSVCSSTTYDWSCVNDDTGTPCSGGTCDQGVCELCDNDNICESSETQRSCPADCETNIALTPNRISPEGSALLTINVQDGRYRANGQFRLDLQIDAQSWSTALCPISGVTLNPSSPPQGVTIASSERQVTVSATCIAPAGLQIGRHTLTATPTIIS